MTFRWWDRWGPLTGILSVAFMLAAFLVASNTPSTDDSNAKIATYFDKSSHQTQQVVGGFLFLAGILLFLAFISVLRSRLVAAEGEPGRLGALVVGAGAANAVFWFTAIALFIGPGITAGDTSKFHLNPDTYRLLNDTGFAFFVAAVAAGALVVWATSAVALRTRILPRWFGRVGIAVGILNLLSFFFIPTFIYWLWMIVTAALFPWRRREPAAPTTPPAAPGGPAGV
jgi:hypothetical protein